MNSFTSIIIFGIALSKVFSFIIFISVPTLALTPSYLINFNLACGKYLVGSLANKRTQAFVKNPFFIKFLDFNMSSKVEFVKSIFFL